jgi:arylsulfatase A-like enzyme
MNIIRHIARQKSFGIILILSLFFFWSCKTKTKSEHKNHTKPNIVILLVDDMGYGALEDYGSPNIRTPNIDSLGDQGIRFTSYEAAPWCVPSRTEWMTGVYAPRINFGGGTGANGRGGLPDSILTLAEGLKKAGYATGMAGKWHLGWYYKKYLPTNKGFDTWLGLPYSNDYKRPYVNTNVPLVMYHDTTIAEYPVNQDSLTVKYTAFAQKFIKAHAGKEPFFFYFAYNMVHLPIHTTKEFMGTSGAGLYGDVVETVDWSVGQVLKTLKQTGVAKNTIVVFASDNGPWSDMPPRMLRTVKHPEGTAWKLRGAGNKPWYQGSMRQLRGAKHMSYEGGPRVPAMIRWPGHIKRGQVSSALVSNMDMFRTLLKAGGGKLPDYPLDGYNMMPFFTGKQAKSPRNTYAYIKYGLEALRVGKWKLKVNKGYPELFNLAIDPGEHYNLAGVKTKIARRIHQRMQKVARKLEIKIDTNVQYSSYNPAKYYKPNSYKLYNHRKYYTKEYYKENTYNAYRDSLKIIKLTHHKIQKILQKQDKRRKGN